MIGSTSVERHSNPHVVGGKKAVADARGGALAAVDQIARDEASVPERHLGGLVGAAVVDHQHTDIHSLDLRGDARKQRRQIVLFVERRDDHHDAFEPRRDFVGRQHGLDRARA
jgi:hypothetical protein